jgi:hypothetical protein
MTPPLSDRELRDWAREHLVYEGRMLAFTTIRLAERQGVPGDADSNVLVESFGIHARCLRDFLWANRGRYPMDAFATDFCAPGRWEEDRGPVPPALARIDRDDRTGREIVHLTYHRLGIPAPSKAWDIGAMYAELAQRLGKFSLAALPDRLDTKTREALQDLWTYGPGPESVASGTYHGGTIPFEGFTASS